MKAQYVEFMREYQSLGHMSKAESQDLYTTYSLNNLQMAGSTIQNELFSIFLIFRQHCYVIAGDVAKMYKQVQNNEYYGAKVHTSHYKYLS